MSNTFIRKWRADQRLGLVFLTGFSIFWNGFVFFALTKGTSGPFEMNGKSYQSISDAIAHDWTTAIFLLFPFFGIAMIYVTASLWLNKTTYEFIQGRLLLSIGPIPWTRKPISLITNTIIQIEIEEIMEIESPMTCAVNALLKTGQTQVLEKGLSREVAENIQKWLRMRLNLPSSNQTTKAADEDR